MHTQATQTEPYRPLQLKAPDLIKTVQRQGPQTQRLVPLKKEFKAKVDALAKELVAAASAPGFEPRTYALKLDDSLKFGRKSADQTSRLVRRFVAKTFESLEYSPAYEAVGGLREQLTALNPNNSDDLLESDKVFGLIPFGNKLSAYFKSYQAAVPDIKLGLAELKTALTALESEAKALNASQEEIWVAMTKLEAAIHYADTLGLAVAKQAGALLTSTPEQAVCLEVAAGHSQDAFDAWSTQQVNNVNTYLSMEALKKAYRELIAGFKQIEACSTAALAAAQAAAEVIGYPLNALPGLSEPRLGQDARSGGPAAQPAKTAEPRPNPKRELASIRAATSTALFAMRELDAFRFQAVGVIKQNSKLLHTIIKSARQSREAHAKGR